MPRDGGWLTKEDMLKAQIQFAEHFVFNDKGKGIVAPIFPERKELIPHLDYRPVIWSIVNRHYEWSLYGAGGYIVYKYPRGTWVMYHEPSRHEIVISNRWRPAGIRASSKQSAFCYCMTINIIQRKANREDKLGLYNAMLQWKEMEDIEARRINRAKSYALASY